MRQNTWIVILLRVVVIIPIVSGCGAMLYEGMLAGLHESKKSDMLHEGRIAEIEKGRTTRGEIEQKFGKPDARVTRAGYESTWTYQRSGIPSWIPGIRNARSQVLIIEFDAEGVVREYEFRAQELRSL